MCYNEKMKIIKINLRFYSYIQTIYVVFATIIHAIFTTILKKQGYIVDIFDVTPYVGEGATAMERRWFLMK